MQAFRTFVGGSDMLAYLAMMAPRLVELQRVLNPTGSIYLHCDRITSHYLKMLMDAVFGPEKFLNEVEWHRTNAQSTRGRWPRIHDALLHYHKDRGTIFHPLAIRADPTKLPHTLVTELDGKKYQTNELLAAGIVLAGHSSRPWRGFDPGEHGRHWANAEDEREAWDAEWLIHWPPDNGWPRRRASEPFNESLRTVIVGDIWVDTDRLNLTAQARLGYLTQKLVELLERIICTSTNGGGTILDLFYGYGTIIDSPQRQKRKWISIDVTYLGFALINSRLRGAYGNHIEETYVIR